MKLKDVIDIDGKLYKVIYIDDDGSFEAEPIGEVIAKGFVRPQNEKHESISLDGINFTILDKDDKISVLDDFCDKMDSDCSFCEENCPLLGYLDCSFEDYTNEQLDEAYNLIIKWRDNEKTY